MFNLSETAKISCHYESCTTAGAIFRETDRTNLYSQYIIVLYIDNIHIYCRNTFTLLCEWKKNKIVSNAHTIYASIQYTGCLLRWIGACWGRKMDQRDKKFLYYFEILAVVFELEKETSKSICYIKLRRAK